MSTHIDALYEEWSADERDAELEEAFHERERLDRLSEHGSALWFSVSPAAADMGRGQQPGPNLDASPSGVEGPALALTEEGAGAGGSSSDVRTPPSSLARSRTHVARPGVGDDTKDEAA